MYDTTMCCITSYAQNIAAYKNGIEKCSSLLRQAYITGIMHDWLLVQVKLWRVPAGMSYCACHVYRDYLVPRRNIPLSTWCQCIKCSHTSHTRTASTALSPVLRNLVTLHHRRNVEAKGCLTFDQAQTIFVVEA